LPNTTLVFALLAFLISFAGCWLITRSTYLRKLGNVAPVENRWHQQATPGLGGIAIFIALAIVAVISGIHISLVSTLLISAFPLIILGTYDDIKPVSPKLKLAAQIFSSLLFLAILSLTKIFPTYLYESGLFLEGATFPIINSILYIFWIVTMINALNLLDNMDGLAAGIALIACMLIAAVATQKPALAGLSSFYFILAGSLGGFLVLNRHPAKLFMGDAGALWLGFMVGIGVLFICAPNISPGESHPELWHPRFWILPILICIVPIADTTMVMITRTMRGQAVTIGGKDHLSHRLACIGLSERTSVAVLCLAALVASLLALMIYTYPPAIWVLPTLVYFIMLLTGIGWLVKTTSAPDGIAMNNSLTHSNE